MDPIEPWIDAEAVRRMARQLVNPVGAKEPQTTEDPGFGPGFEGFIGKQLPKRSDDLGARGMLAPSPVAAVSAAPAPAPAPAPPPLTEPESPRAPESEAIARPVPVVKALKEQPPDGGSAAVVTQHADDEPKPFLIKAPEEVGAVREAEASGERGPLVARMEKFRVWLAEKVDARGMFVLDREGDPVIDDPTYGKLHFLARSLAQAYRPSDGGAGNVHVKIGSDAYLAVVPVRTDFGALVLGAVLPRPLEASAVGAIAKGLEDSLRPERR